MDRAIDRSLPATVAAASSARRLIDELGAALPEERLADARLIASELATNAVRYGTSGASVDMHIRSTGRAIRMEVRSAGPFRLPCSPNAPRGTGLGLVLVSSLADRWGVETGEETLVWAEIGTHRRPSSGAA